MSDFKELKDEELMQVSGGNEQTYHELYLEFMGASAHSNLTTKEALDIALAYAKGKAAGLLAAKWLTQEEYDELLYQFDHRYEECAAYKQWL